jgi:hypothetical protein
VVNIEDRTSRIELTLAQNSSATNEVLEIVTLARGFFRVLGAIGGGVKWLLGIGAAVGATWTAWHNWKG